MNELGGLIAVMVFFLSYIATSLILNANKNRKL